MVTLCETLLRLTAGGVWLQVAKVVIPEVLIGEVNFGLSHELHQPAQMRRFFLPVINL
ncbi:hypothetical protein [Escherichia coli]|uniref:hypothetical protein n=1 Tax=Escherichia coli TaxID=562 RepID=UPI0002CAF949|nr:hypothetical protein EC2731150_3241 [Escherichia coli 2731150]